MSNQSFFNFLQAGFPMSAPLANEIISNFELRELSKNEYFLKEGKISNEYLFLEEGFMRSFTSDLEGNEVTTYFYPRNRVVFEASSFFMRKVSGESIQAITDCRGYAISFEKLNTLFHSIPEFREFGRAMLVKEFAAYKQRTLAMINQTAEERYANLINSNEEIFQYAQLKQIASYLGITDSSLSRIRKEFSKK